MRAIAPTVHDALRPGELALACALTDARWEATRERRVRYVYANRDGGWIGPTDRQPGHRACYRVYPGGHIEHLTASRPRRRG